MIEDVISVLRDEGGRPIVHADRGGHYRGGMWIEKLEGQKMKRSMPRKGNSGDNVACEEFFGRMKTEMYYGIRWETKAELKEAIERYMAFYNGEKIKASLGGLSINEHRDMLAKMSSI